LVFAAPSQVQAGTQFSVRLAIPSDALARSVVAVLAYDPKLVAPVGGAASGPGRISVTIAGAAVPGAQPQPSEVRFQALPGAQGETELVVENASGVDAEGGKISVAVPGSHTLNILPAR